MSGPLDSIGSSYHRILIVDDDPAILKLVCLKLEMDGYNVLCAESAFEALEIIDRHGLPHLAVVDLMMPGMSGFEFCERVLQFCDLPIIMLTAVGTEDAVVKGLQHYAEDYVRKPFSPRELVARIERVLRRVGDFAYSLEPIVRADSRLSIDFAHQQALIDQSSVSLTPTETKLLYLLMRNAGRTVTIGFLLRRLWPMEQSNSEALRVHVHCLRLKIEPDPGRPRYILTERGQGYCFVLADYKLG